MSGVGQQRRQRVTRAALGAPGINDRGPTERVERVAVSCSRGGPGAVRGRSAEEAAVRPTLEASELASELV